MANRFEAYAHLAGQTFRAGYYAAVTRAMAAAAKRAGAAPEPFTPARPTPREMELFRDVLRLQRRDADNVLNGVYPPPRDDAPLLEHIDALRRMFADLPRSSERRKEGRAEEAASLPQAEGLPEYYARNFHYQTDGYLSADSAKLYDLQVETLFLGSGGAMRRQALPAIAEFVRGRDQRDLVLLDVACGTGRFLGQLSAAFPAMPMTGVDLSAAYVAEASEHLAERRGVRLMQGNAEALSIADASQDIVTCVFLYHELPNAVRRTVTAEIARVLKPGGLFMFVDSLQWGDRPDYDGLLEGFPVRFHEPYYEEYLSDDLAAMFAAAGLQPVETSTAFLSKIIASRKTPAVQADA
ncbi:MAG: methyltransferase domain-containing protein [Hyphomicrobiales bacterium]|nr:methyltransferase domain-containing protein [Hyphomicrobiales bacterium]